MHTMNVLYFYNQLKLMSNLLAINHFFLILHSSENKIPKIPLTKYVTKLLKCTETSFKHFKTYSYTSILEQQNSQGSHLTKRIYILCIFIFRILILLKLIFMPKNRCALLWISFYVKYLIRQQAGIAQSLAVKASSFTLIEFYL